MFKFASVNKYSLLNLASSSLYCSHYETFNDPFECWCMEHSGFPDPLEDHDRFLEVIAAWGFSPDNEDMALENYHDYALSLEDAQPNVQYFIDSARISCFCANAENLLMWAHYGDGLRGFCIEFDEDEILKNNEHKAFLYGVEYQKSPPVVDTAIYAVADDQFWFHTENLPSDPGFQHAAETARKLLIALYKKMLATKPLDWQYEREMRLIFHTEQKGKEGCDFKYSNASVKSIIVGEKMTSTHRSELEAILFRIGLNVSIKTARRARSSYNVILE